MTTEDHARTVGGSAVGDPDCLQRYPEATTGGRSPGDSGSFGDGKRGGRNADAAAVRDGGSVTDIRARRRSTDAGAAAAEPAPTPLRFRFHSSRRRRVPNPILTPGDVFAGVGAAQICVKGYSTNVRDVSTEEKDRVYAEYGIAHHTTGQYEVDHRVPLELGGSNDIKNLWPEPALPTPGFHQKDLLENKLHDLVCAGAMPLAVAQHAIASDWYGAYLQYVIR